MAAPSYEAARFAFAHALQLPTTAPPPPHILHMTQDPAFAFARLVNETTNQCTEQKVEFCTNAVVQYVIPSPARTKALFTYLLALSKLHRPRAADFSTAGARNEDVDALDRVEGRVCPQKAAWRRLYVVFVLHDIFMRVRRWAAEGGSAAPYCGAVDLGRLLGEIKDELFGLFRLAACRGEYEADQVGKQLLKLLSVWEPLGIFAAKEIESLRAAAEGVRSRSWEQVLEESAAAEIERQTVKVEETNNWTIPTRHGAQDDPKARWHELPAANGLFMRQTRGFPLRAGAFPSGGYEVENGGQEADPELQKDVTWLHKEVEHAFDKHTTAEDLQDIDPLGNKIWKDTERPTRNQWGFTYEGVDKVRENREKSKGSGIGYEGVLPPTQEPPPGSDVSSAIARAAALAGMRGSGPPPPRFGGRGRGGRGQSGGWRGPPSRGGGGGGGGSGVRRGGGRGVPLPPPGRL